MQKMQECDLIMKGGVTSGVVYPYALVEISKHYRLRNIGGTSAGAIAAVFAAAAEYRRQTAGTDEGFRKITEIAKKDLCTMLGFFQPSPVFRPWFRLMTDMMAAPAKGRSRRRAAAVALVTVFPGRFLLALLVLAAFVGLAAYTGSWWPAIVGILVAPLLLLVLLGMSLRAASKAFSHRNFGICPGLTQDPASDVPGLTNWMTDKLDEIAGRDPAGDPLTIGDLAGKGIQVATMTTDLSSGRPYQLPLRTRIHYFNETEFRGLFPKRVVDYLVRTAQAADEDGFQPPEGFFRLPSGDAFPVLLVARLSLSFPALIEAVPLHRRDFGLAGGPLRRCLFSDGGITSNFPIHFFDEPMPTRPTFGIALARWEEERHSRDPAKRIELPDQAQRSDLLPIRSIESIGGFVTAMFRTAKDWQDTLQSRLPGYAERIVTVLLDPKREGGLNLTMEDDTINALIGYGGEAGKALTARFSYVDEAGAARAKSGFDQHRYDRVLSLLPKLEAALQSYSIALSQPITGAPQAPTGLRVLTDHEPTNYRLPDNWRETKLTEFSRDIQAVGGKAPRLVHPKLPRFDARIRLQANADRVPQEQDDVPQT